MGVLPVSAFDQESKALLYSTDGRQDLLQQLDLPHLKGKWESSGEPVTFVSVVRSNSQASSSQHLHPPPTGGEHFVPILDFGDTAVEKLKTSGPLEAPDV